MKPAEFLVFGEALFDLFVTSTDNPAVPNVVARAGGSPMNVAIGLSRLGCASALLSQISNDNLGNGLMELLAKEGVDLNYLARTDCESTLSVIATDATGQPSYSFYTQGADGTLSVDELPQLPDSIHALHFGSYALVLGETANTAYVLAQREKHRLITLDPNIRPTIEPDPAVWIKRIDALMPYVDVVKISDEDIRVLYGEDCDVEHHARAFLDQGAKLVFLTRGGDGGQVFSTDHNFQGKPPKITVADTVGAGDTFMAMLLCELAKTDDITDADFMATTLEKCLYAAAITCTRVGADLPYLADLDISL
ncbi:hypothetical protein BFP76_03345 [Amylibacter kogurei]|uniref:Carbohydrate kinase PfkB domain-containing protein n=1 Tax=Paramylibacter kogurei TaxID=1889778 RepID=A0A2G5K414_9RHOB|nr:carbohydrate kinase [Amylibacter kogurei]PIB24271.1 hypothetical protein BFP76_03345 [Amylibacter kogurei]